MHRSKVEMAEKSLATWAKVCGQRFVGLQQGEMYVGGSRPVETGASIYVVS